VLSDDSADAAAIATEAGRLLLDLRQRPLPSADLAAEGDARLAAEHDGTSTQLTRRKWEA
jgi:hypothetical protein